MHIEEIRMSMTDYNPDGHICPEKDCNTEMVRMFNGRVTAIFKGTGFYCKDNRGKD